MMEFLDEQHVTLSELLDQDSLQRLCMTFSRLYEAGLAIFDAAGQLLVDVPAELPLCRRVRGSPHGAEICGAFDYMMAKNPPAADDDNAVALFCPCGLRYDVLTLRHQTEVLGRLAYGPYRAAEMTQVSPTLAERLTDKEGQPDAPLFAAVQRDFARLEPRQPSRVVDALSSMRELFGVVVQAGYARHLTSQIHLAAVQDAYEELQEKNRRLADSVERLKELDKLRSSFLATFSHELRTPLTSIIGYSEMLMEGLAGPLVEQQQSYLKTILEKSGHLLRMINEILDISKIQSGTVQLSYQDVSVGQLMDEVITEMTPQARRKRLDISYEVPGDLPIVRGDRSKIRQVLVNLVSNGVKFTGEGGALKVKAFPSRHKVEGKPKAVPAVEIDVTDSGIGIPKENWSLVFEAFYQVDSSSTREYQGTGLGLAIVKQFVEAHGGRVWVKASSNQGTTFAVLLPLRSLEATDAASTPDALDF